MNDPFSVGEVVDLGPWVVEGSYANDATGLLPATSWGDRKVTPLTALAFVGVCLVGGFAVGCGLAALVGRHMVDRANELLGALTED